MFIYCSTLFGDKMDMHSGGEDLLFPHHENELAQSQAYHGCTQWANYWLHSGLLQTYSHLSKRANIFVCETDRQIDKTEL